jgi:hypothetical protein
MKTGKAMTPQQNQEPKGKYTFDKDERGYWVYHPNGGIFCKAYNVENAQQLIDALNQSSKMLASPNFIYCVQYLKNGGERIRAIRLVADVTGLPLLKAKKFVEELHTPIPLAAHEVPTITCEGCRLDFHINDERLNDGTCPVCSAELPTPPKDL